MGIESVTECYEGRGGSMNSTYERRYTRIFDVVTTGPQVGPLAVRAADGLPRIGDHYTNGVGVDDDGYPDDLEEDPGAFVGEIEAECLGGAEGAGIAWRVIVQYQPWDPSAFGPDPTEWPLRVQFSGERTEKVLLFDKTGAPIQNSAFDRFGDPVTIDDHITTMIVTRNEPVSGFDVLLASDFSDTINDATWNGIPAGHAKMGIITTSEEQYDSNQQIWYYKVTYPIQISRKFWRKELLDHGYNELHKGGRRPIMIEGQPAADPVPLDGSGTRLAPGGTPVTLNFDVYDETDWSGLNINLALRLGV